MNRRQNLKALASFLAGSPLLRSQEDPVRDHSRIPSASELVTTFDFEAVAWAKLPRAAYDYMAYGADGEVTLRRNRDIFDEVELIPRRIVAADSPKTEVELFGTKMAFPILISPTAGHSQFYPEGELATHRGAAAANTTMIVSNNSTYPFDKVAAAAKSPVWVQLYPKQQLDANRVYLESAQGAGAMAVVVTIDQQASSYERSLHDRNFNVATPARRADARPPAASASPYRISNNRLWYEWKFFDQIRPFVKVPMLAKGILTAEDAKMALEHGVQGIYVSNHGGRSLDYDPSTLEVLPEIVEAVGGRVPVLFDSGIRRGTDVLKAIALGATAVCVGRVPLWGLGAYGPAGVQRILEILQKEFMEAMRYTGCSSLESINKRLLLTHFS